MGVFSEQHDLKSFIPYCLEIHLCSLLQFLREDLKYNDPKAKHKNFHGADLLITVEDMWNTWRASDGQHIYSYTHTHTHT